jgi:drug/metabolite transporter (DMT)-like permease
MQANARIIGGNLESLLIEHARLNKTPGELARLVSVRANAIREIFSPTNRFQRLILTGEPAAHAMKNPSRSLVLFALAIASIAYGNVLLKQGMTRFNALTAAGTPAAPAVWHTPQLPAGAALMLVQFACTLTLFKWGWDASVVIPVLGLCYVAMGIMGKYLLGEPVNSLRWLGICLITAGVFFVARSSVPGKPN